MDGGPGRSVRLLPLQSAAQLVGESGKSREWMGWGKHVDCGLWIVDETMGSGHDGGAIPLLGGL